MSAPDFTLADNFLSLFDLDVFDFRTFDDTDQKRRDIVTNKRGQLDECGQVLASLNTKKAGVYFTVNRTDGKGRTKEHIERVRALFVDFDTEDADRVADLLESCKLTPTVIVESSPNKHHVYWILSTEGDAFPLDRFECAQEALIRQWDGADPKVKDLPRVMRLVGFNHCKGEPFMTRVVHESGQYHTAADLLAWVESMHPPAKIKQATPLPLPLPSYSAGVDHYAHGALEQAENNLLFTGEGDRNATLNKEAFGLFGLAKAGRLPMPEVKERLRAAALSIGLKDTEVRATLMSAYKAATARYESLPDDAGGAVITPNLQRMREADAGGEIVTLPMPTPLMPDLEAPSAYPVDSLPPLIRDAAKAIAEHVMAPLPLAAACVIGAATHLAQTRVNAPSADGAEWGMPCSLFMLTLADSGDRKSACRKLAFNEIDKLERQNRQAFSKAEREHKEATANMSDKETKKYNKENPLPPENRTIYGSDASFSRIVSDFILGGLSAASWDTDEGGAMFGGHSMKSETRAAVLGGLVQLFDTGKAERDRSRGNDDGSGIAYDRRFSMMLLAQEVAVKDSLSDPLLRGQGFLPRFLFTGTVSAAGTRFRSVDTDDKAAYKDARLQRFWERCHEIMAKAGAIDPETFGVRTFPTEMTREGLEVWTEFYNETEHGQAPLQRYSEMKPFAGRAGELARRLAAVFAHFTGRDYIDGEVMGWACSVVRYSLSEWARYTNSVHVPKVNRQASDAMKWLLDPSRADKWQEFTKDQWGKSAPPALRQAKTRDAVLDLLAGSFHLLTTDGKHYQVSHAARDFGEYAETAETAES